MPRLNPFAVSIEEGSLLDDFENILETNRDRRNSTRSNIDLLTRLPDGSTVLSNLLCYIMGDKNNFNYFISQLNSYTYGENEETLLHILVRDQTVPMDVFKRVVDDLIKLGVGLNIPDRNGRTGIKLSEELGLHDRFNILAEKKLVQEKRGKKIEIGKPKDLGNGSSVVPIIMLTRYGAQVKTHIRKNNNSFNGLGNIERSLKKPLSSLLYQSQNLGGVIDELDRQQPRTQKFVMA